MKIEKGDSIIFGREYLKEYGYGKRRYTGKPILLEMQEFEYDNGLYTEYQNCLGLYDKKNDEPDSIYHLFGNKFEHFMDCELIKATSESLAKFNKIEKAKQDARDKALQDECDSWAEFIIEQEAIVKAGAE